MGFVGLARDEETLLPTPYMESLPESLAGRPVYVLDPMLATGGSMVHTIELLVGRGATDVTAICALAAPEGLVDAGRVRTCRSGWSPASVDERLNDRVTSSRAWATRGTGSSAPSDRTRPDRPRHRRISSIRSATTSRITSSGIGCSAENRIVPFERPNPASRP